VLIMACDAEKLDNLSLQDIPQGWQITSIEGVERLVQMFKFKNFVTAMRFSHEIGELAELHNHHPMIITEWGKVTLHWWTHTAKGISALDIKLAQLSNELNTA
jgi:4a-hydroxytetrahydrobiopterin dehydratase